LRTYLPLGGPAGLGLDDGIDQLRRSSRARVFGRESSPWPIPLWDDNRAFLDAIIRSWPPLGPPLTGAGDVHRHRAEASGSGIRPLGPSQPLPRRPTTAHHVRGSRLAAGPKIDRANHWNRFPSWSSANRPRRAARPHGPSSGLGPPLGEHRRRAPSLAGVPLGQVDDRRRTNRGRRGRGSERPEFIRDFRSSRSNFEVGAGPWRGANPPRSDARAASSSRIDRDPPYASWVNLRRERSKIAPEPRRRPASTADQIGARAVVPTLSQGHRAKDGCASACSPRAPRPRRGPVEAGARRGSVPRT